jgi:hypothetical protein
MVVRISPKVAAKLVTFAQAEPFRNAAHWRIRTKIQNNPFTVWRDLPGRRGTNVELKAEVRRFR